MKVAVSCLLVLLSSIVVVPCWAQATPTIRYLCACLTVGPADQPCGTDCPQVVDFLNSSSSQLEMTLNTTEDFTNWTLFTDNAVFDVKVITCNAESGYCSPLLVTVDTPLNASESCNASATNSTGGSEITVLINCSESIVDKWKASSLVTFEYSSPGDMQRPTAVFILQESCSFNSSCDGPINGLCSFNPCIHGNCNELMPQSDEVTASLWNCRQLGSQNACARLDNLITTEDICVNCPRGRGGPFCDLVLSHDFCPCTVSSLDCNSEPSCSENVTFWRLGVTANGTVWLLDGEILPFGENETVIYITVVRCIMAAYCAPNLITTETLSSSSEICTGVYTPGNSSDGTISRLVVTCLFLTEHLITLVPIKYHTGAVSMVMVLQENTQSNGSDCLQYSDYNNYNICDWTPCLNQGQCLSSSVDSDITIKYWNCRYRTRGMDVNHSRATCASVLIGTDICDCPSEFKGPACEVPLHPRCSSSYVAGYVWPEAIQGETLTAPCTAADPRFTPLSRMSLTCGPGYFLDVDISSCTFASSSSPPLLLLWYSLVTGNVTDVRSKASDMTAEINSLFTGIAPDVTFDLPMIFPTPLLCNYVGIIFAGTAANSNVTATDITDIVLEQTGHLAGISTTQSSFTGAYPADSCECGVTYTSGSAFQQLCVGTVTSPCSCSLPTPTSEDFLCECNSPHYTGRSGGSLCTLDSDQDGFPNVPLECSVEEEDAPYCINDSCPITYNSGNNPQACNIAGEGCPFGSDLEYGIEWPFTSVPATTVTVPCGQGKTGNASRFCSSDFSWGSVDASQCQSVIFTDILDRVTSVFTSDDPVVVMATRAATIVDELSVATANDQNSSLLPQELEVTNEVITKTLDVLFQELSENGTVNLEQSSSILQVLSNVLDIQNLPGQRQLDSQGGGGGSETLLENSERYGLYLATALRNNAQQEAVSSRANIAVLAQSVNISNTAVVAEVIFPVANDDRLKNFTRNTDGSLPVTITIPAELLLERTKFSVDGMLPVSSVLFQNIQSFLSSTDTSLLPLSTVISGQVGVQSSFAVSTALKENPVVLVFNFQVSDQVSDQVLQCYFWEFSIPVGNGSWSRTGVTRTGGVERMEGGMVTVTCTSTHLTSFAVLVDVTGEGTGGLALEIVSYIGLAISLACLLLTIIFFLSLGKKLFSAVHNFVHLNLAISLFIGYLIFAVGVELGKYNELGCCAVAALIQYFLLASFCWMMCEGIMLYLMLVVVFTKLSRKWWFFMLLGWIPPIIFVIIGLSTALSGYGVRDSAGNLAYCWLSATDGSHAIWTFIAPMLAIIIINTVFLVLVLFSLAKNRGARTKRLQEEGKRIELVGTIIKASIILLPLLGLTWVLGLFAVNQNTVLFAWLFTIFNSLQGLFIFVFHVLRSDRIWGRIQKRYTKYQSSTSQSKSRHSTAHTDLRHHTVSEDSKVHGISYISAGSGADTTKHELADIDQSEQPITMATFTAAPAKEEDTPKANESDLLTAVDEDDKA